MQTVTFDTTTKPDDDIVSTAIEGGWHVAFVSVTSREAKGTDFEVSLKSYEKIPELGVWDESDWDVARWANMKDSNNLNDILTIISNNSFPKSRDNLTKGQLHQLRDAMILEAHSAAVRGVFVTGDSRAFINNGRREKLEALLKTRIVTPNEFERELSNGSSGV